MDQDPQLRTTGLLALPPELIAAIAEFLVDPFDFVALARATARTWSLLRGDANLHAKLRSHWNAFQSFRRAPTMKNGLHGTPLTAWSVDLLALVVKENPADIIAIRRCYSITAFIILSALQSLALTFDMCESILTALSDVCCINDEHYTLAFERFPNIISILPMHLQSQARWTRALKDFPHLVGRAPESVLTPLFVKVLVYSTPKILAHLPQFLIGEDVAHCAVIEDPLAIRVIPPALQTSTMVIRAIRSDPSVYSHIRDDLRSVDVYVEVVRNVPRAIRNVPTAVFDIVNAPDAHERERSLVRKMILAAVRCHGELLEFVPPAAQTQEICEVAIDSNYVAVMFVCDSVDLFPLALRAARLDVSAVDFFPPHMQTEPLYVELVCSVPYVQYYTPAWIAHLFE